MRTPDEVRQFIEGDSGLRALLEKVAGVLDDDPGHDLGHCLRVAAWTARLDPDLDAREVAAAALLHDIVNLPKDAPDRAHASERSAVTARCWLPERGFDEDAVCRIAEAIVDHSYSVGRTPRSALGRALQDADRLEALGALGLLRTISTGTRMGARYFHERDIWALRRELDDRAHTIDHFFAKLFRLPATMNSEAGRLEAERRVAFLRSFLVQLSGELGVDPPPAD